jgi:hypothetical protein
VETIFDRMLAKRGKRGWVRDQVMAGARDARNGILNFVARSYLEHYCAEFIKHFDALDEGTSDGVFSAVEAAFHLGECMAATRFRKEVPAVHMRDNMANAQKAPRKENKTAVAVRAAMTDKTTASRKSASLIKDKVDRAVDKDVPLDTIFYHMKKIRCEKKLSSL